MSAEFRAGMQVRIDGGSGRIWTVDMVDGGWAELRNAAGARCGMPVSRLVRVTTSEAAEADAALPTVASDPPAPRPLTRNAWRIALIGVSVLFAFALYLDFALWLRAIEAEVQLGTCQREMRCLRNPAVCR